MNGFSSGNEDEEFRPFIRRLPGTLRGMRPLKESLMALRIQILVLGNQSMRVRPGSLDHPRNRRPRLLAYLAHLLPYPLWPDNASADPVSPLSVSTRSEAKPCRHMIKYRYIPFDLGKKAKYGRSK